MTNIPRLVPTIDEFDFPCDPKSPLGILIGQDEYIKGSTGGLVRSRLDCVGLLKSPIGEFESYSYHQSPVFSSYLFSFVSVTTREAVSIFTIHVGESMGYPVRISSPDFHDLVIVSESEFLDVVKSILCSRKSIDIIRRLK